MKEIKLPLIKYLIKTELRNINYEVQMLRKEDNFSSSNLPPAVL